MPTRNDSKQWECNECKQAYRLKKEATACENRHKWLKAWANGEITDQKYADYMNISVESVMNMAGGSVSRKHIGGQGVFVAATQIYGQGRAQIPHQIRTELGLGDGDNIFWFRGADGRFFLGADVSVSHQRGKMSRRM